VKELLKSDSICESYTQMKKVKFFDSQCRISVDSVWIFAARFTS